ARTADDGGGDGAGQPVERRGNSRLQPVRVGRRERRVGTWLGWGCWRDDGRMRMAAEEARVERLFVTCPEIGFRRVVPAVPVDRGARGDAGWPDAHKLVPTFHRGVRVVDDEGSADPVDAGN